MSLKLILFIINRSRLIKTFLNFAYFKKDSVDKELLERYKAILQKKCIGDNIILLNPELDDLFNDNIYKLTFDEKEYYIPLC